MGLFDRLRGGITRQDAGSPEHLEGYRRIGEQVYEAKVELAEDASPRVRLLLHIAEAFQVMGDALVLDLSGADAHVARTTQEQAETWYGRIPDLLIAARKESVYPGSGQVSLPIQIGSHAFTQEMCPLGYLLGLRRAAGDMEDLINPEVLRLRTNKDEFRETLLLYEEARTRKSTGDALIGSIMGGRNVPHETHEDARIQYWQALTNYLLMIQGIQDNALIVDLFSPKSRLDDDDVWKVTARLAVDDVRASGELEQTQQTLTEFWAAHSITDEERRYQNTVERLLKEGAIQENGYWYKPPFNPVYLVVSVRVEVLGRKIPQGHELVWDYPWQGQGMRFLTRPSFRYAEQRTH
ncbi:hypothetical protein [Alicyclobacillus sp. ALC3]|uniref:hypothetical protein n=1 Tax=Alicyclobacillus sp. ALC3 TaxID=2796143 RepID=UPI00237924A3|nr:hypothetical protein [Alicyclobacillus sp. ALC3]WDL98809.1 hypothetical protein JC200_09230 [Alicyclobacillus sp. ALC3]